jgi:hypothetical protein
LAVQLQGEIPCKGIWISQSPDIIINKCDSTFRALDLVPYLAIEVNLDALFNAAIADGGTMKTTGGNPTWLSSSRGEIFGANNAAGWRWSFNYISRGRRYCFIGA